MYSFTHIAAQHHSPSVYTQYAYPLKDGQAELTILAHHFVIFVGFLSVVIMKIRIIQFTDRCTFYYYCDGFNVGLIAIRYVTT